MKEEGFERKNANTDEDEAAIADFENEGGPVPTVESRESKNEKENFIDSALARCRMVGGKLLCRMGDHDYIEVGRESFHNGEDEVVHLECRRKDCSQKAWTEWHKNERVL